MIDVIAIYNKYKTDIIRSFFKSAYFANLKKCPNFLKTILLKCFNQIEIHNN